MAPIDLPDDGFGGYLYDTPISLPNYANTTISTSYAVIDYVLFTGSGSASTIGIVFGACLMTLIHVLVFTTPDKRGRIIFNCIVAGLVLEIARDFTGIWSVTRSGTNSSYFLLTLPTNGANQTDADNLDAANRYTNFSLGTNVNGTVNEITSLLAFLSVQVCFYVLVYAMMAAIRRKTVRIVTISLAILGCHAVVWRLVQVTWSTVNVFRHTSTFAPPGVVQFGTSIAYTISICSWCLVYGYLIICSALNRIRMGVGFKRGEARHVMFMTALESMLIPLMFMVLQWISPSWFPESEYCVVPSILILLPFGTLWATTFDPNEAHRGHSGRYQPNGNRGLDSNARNPTATNNTSATDDSTFQPLVDQRATRSPGTTTMWRPSDCDTNSPAPPTPTASTFHPLDNLLADGGSADVIYVRRQLAVTSC